LVNCKLLKEVLAAFERVRRTLSIIIFIAVCHDFEQFDSDFSFLIASQHIAHKVNFNFHVYHLESAPNDAAVDIGVPELLDVLLGQHDEVRQRVIFDYKRAAFALRVPQVHICKDPQEHPERLLRYHVHCLLEIFARSLRGLLTSEELVNHPAPHVVPNLVKLLVDLLRIVIICFSE